MSMAFRAVSGAHGTTSTTTGTLPTGWQPGDLVAFFMQGFTSSSPTTPTGWTAVPTSSGNSTNRFQIWCYWRLMQTGDTGPAFTGLDTASGWGYEAIAYSAAPVSSNYLDSRGNNQLGAGSAALPSAMTPAGAYKLVSRIVGNPGNAQTVGSGFTARSSSDVNNSGAIANALLEDKSLAGGVSSGTTMSTWTGSQGYDVLAVAFNDVAPPLAPTLTAPVNASYQDLASGFTFTWTYNLGTTGATQTGYALRRKISGAGSYEWWNAGTSAWQGTEIFNTSTSQSLTFGAGKWTNGNIYNWSVVTQDANGTGPYASDLTVTASSPPTVVVSAPSGTTASSSPTVSWSDTLQSGASQTTYRVVVESGAYSTTPGSGTTVWDSGTVSSTSTTATTGATLTNGTTYRWFVQITETGGQTSSWSYTTATASFTPPATPTLTATVDLTNARTALVLTNNDAGTVTGGIIEASDDGGTTWTTVRGTGAVSLTTGANTTIYDYEATPTVARRYRARVSNTQAGQTVTSANATAGPVTITLTKWWIKDPVDPTLNTAVNVSAFNPRMSEAAGTFRPMGRGKAVVVADSAIGGLDGDITVTGLTQAEWPPVLAIMRRQHALLLQAPWGEQWYVRINTDRSVNIPSSWAWQRETKLAYVEVDAP